MLRSQFIGCAAGIATLAVTSVSYASFTASDLNIQLTAADGSFNWTSQNNPGAIESIEQVGENQYRIVGAWSTGNWACSWDMTVNTAGAPGAATRGLRMVTPEFVISNFAFTNTTGSTGNFLIGVTANVGSFAAPTGIAGSVSGTVLSGSPAVNTATFGTYGGNSIYTALMDGVAVRTLLDDPFSASTMFTTNFGTADFGIPTPEVGPALASTLGIEHRFSLTNNDSVTFSSAFVVVPTPGAAGLLAMGGLLAMRRRR